jgi:hypothetical protein
MRITALALLFMLPFTAFAGGTAFSCKYESLESDGSGGYVLTLRALSEPDVAVTYTPDQTLMLHLTFSAEDPLPSGVKPVTHAEFEAAITQIRSDLTHGGHARFGVLGAALREIKDQPGHYRVYGLRIEDERFTGDEHPVLVVYAH